MYPYGTAPTKSAAQLAAERDEINRLSLCPACGAERVVTVLGQRGSWLHVVCPHSLEHPHLREADSDLISVACVAEHIMGIVAYDADKKKIRPRVINTLSVSESIAAGNVVRRYLRSLNGSGSQSKNGG